MRELTICVGKSRTTKTWNQRSTSWESLLRRLESVHHTSETVEEYHAFSKAAKATAKDCGGFVAGSLKDGARNGQSVLSRSMLTLDIDFASADTLPAVDDYLFNHAWCVYSTHSHTTQNPRLRLVVPLDRDVTPDEYIPIARRVAEKIGIDQFDDTTYEPARLMFWPSCPSDGDYVFRTGAGDPLSADEILATYIDWTNPLEWPVSRRVQRLLAPKGQRAEDPVLKKGIVGTFCRAYGIREVIGKYLSDVYEPTGSPDRWTYVNGSTSGGLIIYDNKFAFSHHGTDPASERLLNAFDLVRIHRYSGMDEDADAETPVAKLPSFLAMQELAGADEDVRTLAAREKVRSLDEDFGSHPEEGEAEESAGWMKQLKMDSKMSKILPTPANIGIILRNDPRLKDTVSYEEFSRKNLVTRDLPWRKAEDGIYWTNSDDCGLQEYMSKQYDITGKNAILDEHDLVMSQSRRHVVREYFASLPSWDGTARVDTVLVDYLGAEDSALTRAMTRKHLVAAVARIMEPGCKYDYTLMLVGSEGLGKSTLIRLLAKDKWFSDSLTSVEGREAMEQLQGVWHCEQGELTNYKKSTVEAYKAFQSKCADEYRAAYARQKETFLRQCVFWATTNEKTPLKGDTGNRRFWVVTCGADVPEKNVWSDLPGEVDLIWAEALVRYRAGEKLYLDSSLEALARTSQDAHNEIEGDPRNGIIRAFITRLLPTDWQYRSKQNRQDFFRGSSEFDSCTVRRESISAIEVYNECFGERLDDKTRYKTREINQMLRKIEFLGAPERRYDSCYGRQWSYPILWDKTVK